MFKQRRGVDAPHDSLHTNRAHKKGHKKSNQRLTAGVAGHNRKYPLLVGANRKQQVEKYWEGLEQFDKTCGALGIIPKDLLDILKQRCPENNKEKIHGTVAYIQILILMGMQDAWNHRCRKTKWAKRLPDRGNT